MTNLNNIFLLYVLSFAFYGSLKGEIRKGYVYFDVENGFKYKTIRNNGPSSPVAWGYFDDQVQTTGWGSLEISSNQNFSDSVQAYGAGLLEGQLTRDFVNNRFLNEIEGYCKGRTNYCDKLKTFLEKNMDFMNKNIAKKSDDPFWYQVSLILQQVAGIDDGVKNISGTPRTRVDIFGTMFMNLFGDLFDLEAALSTKPQREIGSGSCSGLIKVLEGHKDIFFAHDAWYTYRSMLRMMKKYSLKFKTAPGQGVIPGHTVSFSSYPGGVFSGDDFYLLSTGLAVMETTNTNYNLTLAREITPSSVLDWARNIVANRLAQSGREWTKIYSRYNSGTYNNQFMILDYKLFKPGEPLKDNLLWVAEQMPGYLITEDVTHVLRQQSYWPSYNTPYFKEIYDISGYPDMVKKYGDFFTYERAPRALIFKRDHGKVVNLKTMTNLMRYNNFTQDPLSRCNCTPPYSALNAIAARGDLNDPNGTYPFEELGHKAGGATDMKLTNYEYFKAYQFVGICGPTHESLPPFRWSTSGFKDNHYGQPDLFNFGPVVYKWRHV